MSSRNSRDLFLVTVIAIVLTLAYVIHNLTGNVQSAQPAYHIQEPNDPDEWSLTPLDNPESSGNYSLSPPDTLLGISYAPADPDAGGNVYAEDGSINYPDIGNSPPFSAGNVPTQNSLPVPQPSLTYEMDWLLAQQNQGIYPNASVTRVPLALNSQNATGNYSLRGYTPALQNYVSFASGSEPAPSYAGAVSLSLQKPIQSGQTVIFYALTDQAYPQIPTGHSGDGLFYNFTTEPGNRYVGVIYEPVQGIIATTELLGVSLDPNYKINSAVVTDAEYYQFATPLKSDGTYNTDLLLDYVTFNLSAHSPSGNPQLLPQSFTTGPYISQLVPYSFVPNPAQEPPPVLYAATVLLTGLITSYQIPPFDPAYPFLKSRGFTYDQALLIFALMAQPYVAGGPLDQAVLSACQIQDQTVNPGRWYFEFDSNTGVSPDPYFRVGASAWMVYAMMRYYNNYPSGLYRTNALNAAKAQITDIEANFRTTVGSPQGGLVQLGFGYYDANSVFHAVAETNASTEHNVDYSFGLKEANIAVPSGGYGTLKTTTDNGIINKLWGKSIYGDGVSPEGILVDGTLDTAEALDASCSWIGLWWLSKGNEANAKIALANAQTFFWNNTLVSGYAPYNQARGYPDALPNVWSEGTFGVALLQYRIGQLDNPGSRPNQFYQTIDNMIYLRANGSVLYQSAGGWQYSAVPDQADEISTWPGASGTCWSIFCLTPAIRDTIMA